MEPIFWLVLGLAAIPSVAVWVAVGRRLGVVRAFAVASVVEAVQCAVEIQQEISNQDSALPHAHRMRFRIGINLGDVMVDGSDIYGDGVNIAARLQELAEPGGVVISAGTRSLSL